MKYTVKNFFNHQIHFLSSYNTSMVSHDEKKKKNGCGFGDECLGILWILKNNPVASMNAICLLPFVSICLTRYLQGFLRLINQNKWPKCMEMGLLMWWRECQITTLYWGKSNGRRLLWRKGGGACRHEVADRQWRGKDGVWANGGDGGVHMARG